MNRKNFLMSVFIVSVAVITIAISVYNSQGRVASLYVESGTVISDAFEVPSVVDLSIYYNKELVHLPSPLYLINHRLYLPLEEFVDAIGGRIQMEGSNIVISDKNGTSILDISQNICSGRKGNFTLKENVWDNKGKKYINFIDLENLMGFWCEWDHTKSIISIYPQKTQIKPDKIQSGKTALIRLEDIGAGGLYKDPANLTKLKIIGNYLYSKGIPFHLAWIPRYVSPEENYDYDFLKQNDLYGAEFVYTFDYLVQKGAVVGLHGYTHQFRESQSGIGYEFYDMNTKEYVEDTAYMEGRIKSAIETANALKIEYYFYESPHYWMSPQFAMLIEKNFKYLYQSNTLKFGKNQKAVDHRANGAVYVPTPLGYLLSGDGENTVIKNLDKIAPNTLASFFFHPFLEFKYIELKDDGTYTYDEGSKLHQTLDVFREKGYKFIRIDQI